MVTGLFTRRFGAEKCLFRGPKLGQKRVFLTEDHLLEDWYLTVSISCACGKQLAILQSSSCRSSQVNTSLTYQTPKFSSQRRKKGKFYENRFTSRQGVNEEGLVPVESPSSGSAMSSSDSVFCGTTEYDRSQEIKFLILVYYYIFLRF